MLSINDKSLIEEDFKEKCGNIQFFHKVLERVVNLKIIIKGNLRQVTFSPHEIMMVLTLFNQSPTWYWDSKNSSTQSMYSVSTLKRHWVSMKVSEVAIPKIYRTFKERIMHGQTLDNGHMNVMLDEMKLNYVICKNTITRKVIRLASSDENSLALGILGI